MGTNYYLHKKADCECCGRPYDFLHIGKSSGGWCFSLHVIPDENINTLDDWRNLWGAPGAYIRNEYGEKLSISDMELIITARLGGAPFDDRYWENEYYTDEGDFHYKNKSQRGPNNLLRHQNDGRHCVGHGDGTWDYIAGEFS